MNLSRRNIFGLLPFAAAAPVVASRHFREGDRPRLLINQPLEIKPKEPEPRREVLSPQMIATEALKLLDQKLKVKTRHLFDCAPFMAAVWPNGPGGWRPGWSFNLRRRAKLFSELADTSYTVTTGDQASVILARQQGDGEFPHFSDAEAALGIRDFARRFLDRPMDKMAADIAEKVPRDHGIVTASLPLPQSTFAAQRAEFFGLSLRMVMVQDVNRCKTRYEKATFGCDRIYEIAADTFHWCPKQEIEASFVTRFDILYGTAPLEYFEV